MLGRMARSRRRPAAVERTFLGIPLACGSGVDCGWIQFYTAIVVPGHWVSVNVWGASSYTGEISGAEGSTQVSIAARP